MSNISIVIGSWGSYNECNERALGSKWLDLEDFDSFEEIEQELTKQGFELNGIDEELFIQDIEGIDAKDMNCDYIHPKHLFELLQEADVISNDYNYEIMSAFLEVRSFSDFESRVKSCGSNWTADIYLYKNTDWYDLGYNFMHECYQIPDCLDNYIDYEKHFRITAILQRRIFSCILDSNGMFEKLWKFSGYLVNKGFNIIDATKIEATTDTNIEPANEDIEHIILQATQDEKVGQQNNTIQVADKYYNKVII